MNVYICLQCLDFKDCKYYKKWIEGTIDKETIKCKKMDEELF